MFAAAALAVLAVSVGIAVVFRPRRRALPLPTPAPVPGPVPRVVAGWQAIHDRLLARADRELEAGRTCHGEALLRRAIDLARDAQPGAEAIAAARLAEAPTSAARARTIASLSLERVTICVELECALYRWRARGAAYEPFAELVDRWYFLAPASWADEPAAKVGALVEAILADVNARRADAEPTDPSFVAPRSHAARVMSAADVLATPWKTALRCAPWSLGAGYLVDDPRAFFPCRPSELVPLVALSLVLAGSLSPLAATRHLVAYGLDAATATRLPLDAARELTAALAFYMRGLA